ncbi:MAG: carboxylating nicotinate-nucleotide diphosphorylase [Myxococcales bacterium]|nr:carboxylating nicotinate-nucleotide diphosphorylase [Myxococcales bacterium]
MNDALRFLPSAAELSPLDVARIVDTALAEDLGSGDVTTRSVVPREATARGVFSCREPMVLAGIGVAGFVFARLDPAVRFEVLVADGSHVEKGAEVARVEGPAQSVLSAERVALNIVQRMSGTATRTRDFVRALPAGARTRITDTRKTTPGLRALERYAVRMGGGHNHRNDLGAAVLIKDNHIAVSGGVTAAVTRARAHAPHTMRIECEVQSFEQLDEALAIGVDVLMLDNFDDTMTAEAMQRIAKASPRPWVEASGGITRERIATLAALGVDILSIGSLTHGARAIDIGLDVSVSR